MNIQDFIDFESEVNLTASIGEQVFPCKMTQFRESKAVLTVQGDFSHSIDQWLEGKKIELFSKNHPLAPSQSEGRVLKTYSTKSAFKGMQSHLEVCFE